MTRNPGKPQPGPPSGSVGHRQKIESIEYTISTTMPGKIGLPSLHQFSDQITGAIDFLRTSRGQCRNKTAAISYLEDAKIPLQIAIDEARPGGNSGRRYQKISSVGKILREALKNW